MLVLLHIMVVPKVEIVEVVVVVEAEVEIVAGVEAEVEIIEVVEGAELAPRLIWP